MNYLAELQVRAFSAQPHDTETLQDVLIDLINYLHSKEMIEGQK